MGGKILLLLNMCLKPTNINSLRDETIRNKQYIDGINSVFKYKDILNKYGVDICLSDNTINDVSSIPHEIMTIIPSDVKIITKNANTYGSINKGSGLLETWGFCMDIIKQYDWVIHFETRQILENFDFVINFLESNRNLFTLGDSVHFNTGLFCIDSSLLLKYIRETPPMSLRVSIENHIFDFVKRNGIYYDTADKMGLLWHDTALSTWVHW
uniref:Glycosyltransferase n=1 Tax=viral metagenome TaxID=1070528 RepID=A0A6C0E3Q7_9ZZZZ